MNSTRGVAAWVLVIVMLLGPFQPWALAQQAPPSPSDAMDGQTPGAVDVYDVGAGAVTVLRAPFNIALCALGSAVGTVLFALTLGSAYKASTRVVEEGCAQKWVVRGYDLRPPRGAAAYSEPANDHGGRESR